MVISQICKPRHLVLIMLEHFHSNVVIKHTGCPKKTQFLGILAITPLWKGLELKVECVSSDINMLKILDAEHKI